MVISGFSEVAARRHLWNLCHLCVIRVQRVRRGRTARAPAHEGDGETRSAELRIGVVSPCISDQEPIKCKRHTQSAQSLGEFT